MKIYLIYVKSTFSFEGKVQVGLWECGIHCEPLDSDYFGINFLKGNFLQTKFFLRRVEIDGRFCPAQLHLQKKLDCPTRLQQTCLNILSTCPHWGAGCKLTKHQNVMFAVKINWTSTDAEQRGRLGLWQNNVSLKSGFLVICAGQVLVQCEHNGQPLPKVCVQQFLYENGAQLCSYLFLVKDKAPGRNLIRKQHFETWHWSNLFLSGAVDPNNMAPGANHTRTVGLFFVKRIWSLRHLNHAT